ncbi:ABC transporter permease [Clostridium sp. DL1XJH146]
MRPLSSYIYIKSNIKKILPSFISTIISVLLIFIFGLLLYSCIDDFNKISTNIMEKGTYVFSNSIEHPLSENIKDYIYNDDSIKDVVPMLGYSNSFNYNAAFGNVGTQAAVMYSEDVEKTLKYFEIQLVEGVIPRNNKDEILLPEEYVKQYGLKLGDYINNDTSKSVVVEREYKLVGITKGNRWVPIVCDVGDLKRQDALNYGMMYFFNDNSNMEINDDIIALDEENVVIQDYNTVKELMDEIASGIDFLYFSLDIVILLVLIISLSNLNYIVFLNRKNEFAILGTIGFSKAKLRWKLFKENLIVCFVGFTIGIGLTSLITYILNIVIWLPQGQYVQIFRGDSFLIALIVPVAVSILSMLSSVREMNKLDMDSLNI